MSYFKIEIYEVFDRLPQRSDTKYVKKINSKEEAIKKAFKEKFYKCDFKEYDYINKNQQILLRVKEIKFI